MSGQDGSGKRIAKMGQVGEAGASAVELERQVALLRGELGESRAQQAATAEVLKVISGSGFDLDAVLTTLIRSAIDLCDAARGVIWLLKRERLFLAAHVAYPDEWVKFAQENPIAPAADSQTASGLAAFTGEIVNIEDILTDPRFRSLAGHALGNYRGGLSVPLKRDGRVIGVVSLSRPEARLFTDRQVALVQTFADQAVIAIENVRLFDEVQARNRDLAESLEQQIAMSAILRVIAASPGDIQPVLSTVVENAAKLCDAYDTTLLLRRGDALSVAAHSGAIPIDFTELPLRRDVVTSRAVIDRAPVHVHDLPSAGDEFGAGRALAQRLGFRTILATPLLREGEAIGAILIRRAEVRPFSEAQIALLQTFADQAVIAIENVRLFEEVQARTAELTDALQQQTATADVLKVISRSAFDLQLVLQALVDSAMRLCGADMGAITLLQGSDLRFMAGAGQRPELREYEEANPHPIGRGSFQGRAAVEGRTVHVPDVFEDTEYERREAAIIGNFRAVLSVPLKRGAEVIGVFGLAKRAVGLFAPRQIELVETFADQAVIAIENVRLFDEVEARNRDLTESLERQTAMSDILRVISRSPTDVQPVFEMIAESAARLCSARFCSVYRFDGELIHFVAQHGMPPEGVEAQGRTFPMRPGRASPASRAILNAAVEQIPDVDIDPDYQIGETARATNARSVLAVPILRDGRPVGCINIGRQELGEFPPRQVELLQTFADQAAIAIENVRLFEEVQARTTELSESLQQQTATADVLKVISRSAFDLQTVLDTLTASASVLCAADQGIIYLLEADSFHAHSLYPADPEFLEFLRANPRRLTDRSLAPRVARSGRVEHIPDKWLDPDYQTIPGATSFSDTRTLLGVPLLREGKVAGVFTLSRFAQNPFTSRQIEIVQSFADQAVIAIENVRLFEEVQARNRALAESLEQQTAMSEILRVISRSPTDVQPVFETIAESAARLCNAQFCFVHRFDGTLLHFMAYHGLTPEAVRAVHKLFPMAPGQGSVGARAVLSGAVEQIPDLTADPDYALGTLSEALNSRSTVAVPMLRDGVPIGVIALDRTEVGYFPQRQVELLKTFADQAVIAIENVRLFEEVQARTTELSESLRQQIATADVLKVISRSAFDLEAVLQTLVQSAARLCDADIATITRQIDGVFFDAETYGLPPELTELIRTIPINPDRGSVAGRALLESKVVQIADVLSDPEYTFSKDARDVAGYRTLLGVPMIREGIAIGVLTLGRRDVRPFAGKQIELVSTFADQAAIAIENARLFEEVQAKTRDLSEALVYQTGSGNILRVIASSPTDVGPVLKAIVDSSCELCDAYDAAVLLKDGNDLVFRAHHGTIPIGLERWPINRDWVVGRAAVDKVPVHFVHDLDFAEQSDFSDGREMARRMGHRSILSVPLLREGESIGAIVVRRTEANPFSDKQIALLQTFADQAVIAIGNVRLFEQVQERTEELSRSLQDLRAAQDRLVQTEKLASLGQLTAGIAHEIKNPLNFVNNFSSLSGELIDELREALQGVALDEKRRAEVTELTDMLRGNLDKVVQHGKRADSIVKNMLLHSREGSGEHRPTSINAIVEEALNLAYHGARAEKQGFNITMEKSLDPAAGEIDLYPQEVTRVLLNLVANGFYATTKRKTEADGVYEPILAATTKDLGDSVEIRIRDNGTGIPPEVKERMFNPFFTTKPAGEGTGLGLSLSHDIVVKQHAGTIEVETEPGAFTEFRIVLPRRAAALGESGGRG